MPFLATLLLKFPSLVKIFDFFKSKEFITILAVVSITVVGYLGTKRIINKYVSNQIIISEQKSEITELKNQIKVTEDNKKVVDGVTSKLSKKSEIITSKSNKIESQINENIKKGNDGYVGPIIVDTIDSM